MITGKCIQSCEEADANGVAPFEGTECGDTDLSRLFVSLTAKKVEVRPATVVPAPHLLLAL